jgi:hypothetical protein
VNNPSSNTPIMQGGSPSFIQTWINAITKPNEQTYAEMAASPQAKATTAFLWVFIGALIEFFVVFLVQGAVMRQMLEQRGLGANLPTGGLGLTLITLICGAPIAAVMAVVLFAIDVALVQWIAKMFGGRGTFEQLAYTFGAIQAPFYLISAVFALLGAIPFVGFCFRIVIGLAGLYILVLAILAVKGVNQFGWGPAVGSALIPGAALLLVCCCVVFAGLALTGAAIGNVFNSINQSLTP